MGHEPQPSCIAGSGIVGFLGDLLAASFVIELIDRAVGVETLVASAVSVAIQDTFAICNSNCDSTVVTCLYYFCHDKLQL
jgi:hypothetical protein